MVQFIALAHAGGSANSLSVLRRQLPPTIEFRALELPGRGARYAERLHSDRPALVKQLCAELAAECTRPYVLFGHSLGATLAFELAHALIARGCRAPQLLFAAAAAAPSCRPEPSSKGPLSDADLEAELREHGGTPSELFDHPQLVELFMPIVRADFRLCEAASPEDLPPLPCPIHVFAGRRDRLPPEQLLAWRRETQREFSLRWFEGDHFFVHSHAHSLCSAIVTQLADAGLLPEAPRAHA